jgi:hypothetical protein
MAARTAWTPGNGNGAGLTWLAAFSASSGADLNVGLTNGQSIMSSVVYDNSPTGGLDQFCGFSYVGALGTSSAIAAGATIPIWLACLEGDGSTYGDGLLTAGSAFAAFPGWQIFTAIPLYPSTRTTVIGNTFANGPLVLPPCKFRVVAGNNTGFTLGVTTTNQCYIATFNQNLNN